MRSINTDNYHFLPKKPIKNYKKQLPFKQRFRKDDIQFTSSIFLTLKSNC